MFTTHHYPHQRPDERIVFYLRRHWFVFFKTILFYAVLLIFPYLFFLLSETLFPNLLSSSVGFPAIVIGASIYYLFIWLFFFHAFADYYLDMWIVTNHRIINIEQEGLFARVISEQDLQRIQDITSDIHGFFPTLFGYGNVHIQTAGEQQRFTFEQVSHAAEVARNIQTQVRLCQAHGHTLAGANQQAPIERKAVKTGEFVL